MKADPSRYTAAMNATTRIATTALALALLAGCGNKGPLVLPTEPPPIDPATLPDTQPEPVPADATPTDPEAAEPATDSTTPPETPAPPASDGDGNG